MGPLSPRAIVWSALALGGLLRIIGIAFGLPDLYHADEPIVVNHALAFGTGDLNPHFFHLPPLVSYLVFGLFGVGYLVGWLLGQFPTPDAYLEAFLTNPTAWYLAARLVFGALIGAWTIWLTYRLACRTLGERPALWAATFFACALLAVREAHYVYVDVSLGALVLMVHLKLLEFDARPTWRSTAWLGVWLGVTVATKYNGAFLTIPVAWVLATRWVSEEQKRWWVQAAALIGVSAALAFVVLNPFAVLDWQAFLADVIQERQAMGSPGPWHHIGYSLMGGVGSVMTVLGGAALVWWLARGRRAQRLVAVFPMFYLVMLGGVSQLHERYVLILAPFWALGAAWVVTQLWNRLTWRWLAIALGVAMLGVNLARSVALDGILTQPDIRQEAKQWIEEHLASGSRIAIDHQRFGPQLARHPEQLKLLLRIPEGPLRQAKQRKLETMLRFSEQLKTSYRVYYLYPEGGSAGFTLSRPTLPFDLERLRAEGIEYVIVHGRPPPLAAAAFYRELEQSGVVIKEFSPYRDGRMMARDRLPMTGAPFVDELFARRANGYPLRIYRLK